MTTRRKLGLRMLPRAFFSCDPRRVARELLGKLLIRNRGKKVLVGRIVEVEAYLGKGDPAAHAAAGLTARNRVLFGPPGHAYVYFIYGNHFCLNVSCQPEGKAGCVLIRALEPIAGFEEMARARGLPRATLAHFAGSLAAKRKLTTGPGRLCQAMGITHARDTDKDLTSARSDLWLADDGFRPRRILRTPRVGINKAAARLLRYTIAGNYCVSAKGR
jgi:DNA-3-methyladenine glycosylase